MPACHRGRAGCSDGGGLDLGARRGEADHGARRRGERAGHRHGRLQQLVTAPSQASPRACPPPAVRRRAGSPSHGAAQR